MSSLFDAQLFKESLIQTIMWCQVQLQDSVDADNLRRLCATVSDMPGGFSSADQTLILEDLMKTVFVNRKNWFVSNYGELPEMEEPVNLEGGMIVVFLADFAIANDGIAQMESDGFFDFWAYPACDTWIYHTPRTEKQADSPQESYNHIFSWVPPQFLEGVQLAISSSYEEAIVSLSKSKEVFDYIQLVEELIME